MVKVFGLIKQREEEKGCQECMRVLKKDCNNSVRNLNFATHIMCSTKPKMLLACHQYQSFGESGLNLHTHILKGNVLYGFFWLFIPML